MMPLLIEVNHKHDKKTNEIQFKFPKIHLLLFLYIL